MTRVRSIRRSGLFRPGVYLSLIVFIVALALYVATLAPGLLWGGGDFATFQTKAFLGDVKSDAGAFGHPLWVALAHPFTKLPIRDAAWRANLASAVFASAALVLVFHSAWLLCRSVVAALVATSSLAVSHTFWTYAVMPKVYSLNALLLTACILLLLRWERDRLGVYLYAFAVLYGISLLNHMVMATAVAGFFAYIGIIAWRRRHLTATRRQILVATILGVLGLGIYIAVLVQADATEASSSTVVRFLTGLLHLVTAPGSVALGLALGLALLIYQFPVMVPIGLSGTLRLWREKTAEAWMLLLIAFGDVLFLLAATDPGTGGHYVWNLHYYLQAYVVFALLLAAGLAWLWREWCSRIRVRHWIVVLLAIAFPVLLYAAAPLMARPFAESLPGFRPLPGRDNLTYVLSPWKHGETGAQEFGDSVLESLPPGSVLFADYSIWAVIHYFQVVEGVRTDVEAVQLPYAGSGSQLPVILDYQEAPNLFLADTWQYYDTEDIRTRFEIIPWPPIHRLIPR